MLEIVLPHPLNDWLPHQSIPVAAMRMHAEGSQSEGRQSRGQRGSRCRHATTQCAWAPHRDGQTDGKCESVRVSENSSGEAPAAKPMEKEAMWSHRCTLSTHAWVVNEPTPALCRCCKALRMLTRSLYVILPPVKVLHGMMSLPWYRQWN